MNHFLIVGHSSVAGQMAIKAIRRRYPCANITVTSSKPCISSPEHLGIPNVDLFRADSIESIREKLTEPVDVLVFCPAFGMVGVPAQQASIDDVKRCLAFSVEPLVKLLTDLNPRLAIAFSSFYWLYSFAAAYGTMAYAKYALELMAMKAPKNMRIVRAGVFDSPSLHTICQQIQESVIAASFPEAALLKEGWIASATRFSDYFVHFSQTCEIGGLQEKLKFPYRGTVAEDLSYGLEQALEPDALPIVNVVGPTIWQESHVNAAPDFMRENSLAMEEVHKVVGSLEIAPNRQPVYTQT